MVDFQTFLSDPALQSVFSVYFFVVGTILGSFLNVCIYRLPEGISIITPRSKCPNCKTVIPWYRNIPLLSYVLLLGKCHNCKIRISPVYPLVELMTGLVTMLLFKSYGLSLSFLIYLYFACSVIVLMFIDYYHRILPDRITLTGIVIGLAASFFNPQLKPVQALLGMLLGALLPTVVYLVFKWIRKKEGMGQGDIKMLGMVGAFLGWQMVLLVLLFSSLLGSIVGVVGMLVLKKGSDFEWPFGTYIALAALIALFWGAPILAAYLRL